MHVPTFFSRQVLVNEEPAASVVPSGMLTSATSCAWLQVVGAGVTPPLDGTLAVPPAEFRGTRTVTAEERDTSGLAARSTSISALNFSAIEFHVSPACTG